MSNFITIFTPTYNRAHLLERLYKNLCEQEYQNFEWLIIDDGSTDNTREIIENYKREGKLNIQYFYKENGGKHTAINFGLEKAQSDIFFLLDSDDFLEKSATKVVAEKWDVIRNTPSLCGIVGLSKFLNKEVRTDAFPEDDWVVSFTDIYFKYKILGDKPVAFKTSVMKEFPFPYKKGIHFVFEAVSWHEMAKKYNVLAVNDLLQYKEYTEDGITRNTYKKDYVKGLAFSFFHLVKNRTYPFAKYPHHFLWNYIHLAINSLLSGESYFNQLSLIDKIIYLMFYPRAYYTYSKLKDKVV
ncbi:Undecaprenyl-phosphate 4-deoxy-4-formamido-L-arabinose transferase [bioreactor metagenome]|uniref:Undecaprenyl-phosphate 4-deoxy-4-formamido-L-arabinose transferase n=1 Tax=bioreactor metagenome TaxID=1076179 RepID=A0A644SLZ7_9ZZZZ